VAGRAGLASAGPPHTKDMVPHASHCAHLETCSARCNARTKRPGDGSTGETPPADLGRDDDAHPAGHDFQMEAQAVVLARHGLAAGLRLPGLLRDPGFHVAADDEGAQHGPAFRFRHAASSRADLLLVRARRDAGRVPRGRDGNTGGPLAVACATRRAVRGSSGAVPGRSSCIRSAARAPWGAAGAWTGAPRLPMLLALGRGECQRRPGRGPGTPNGTVQRRISG
jgi:hypothetical protein